MLWGKTVAAGDRSGYDCSNPKLSTKARRMFCRGEEHRGLRPQPHRDIISVSTEPAHPLTAPTERWSKPYHPVTIAVPVTTTENWMESIPECASLQPDFDDMTQECKNSTTAAPIIRYRDVVFERLIFQAWEDIQDKIRTEKRIYGYDLEPLHVDKATGAKGPIVDMSKSSIDLQMWNMQVHGLADIYLNKVLVSRDQNLHDLYMKTEFRFDSLTANGTYNMNGTIGGSWFGTTITSDGDRTFNVDVTNATFTPKIVIDTSTSEAPCGKNGDVLITEIEFPFSYDDISIGFTNLGGFANAAINTLSIFALKTQEENLKETVRAYIKNTVNSIIC